MHARRAIPLETQQARKNDFTLGSIPRNIMSLAVPLIVAQLTVVLYNVVDRAFIGHIESIGREAFTGVGLAMPVTMVITAFANLCGSGGAPLASIARGRGDTQRAQHIMGVSFTFLLLLGVLLTTFFYLFCEPILYMMGGSDETVPYAMDYLLIYLAGTLPVMLVLGMNPFINSQGFGRTGMMTTLLGAVINLILDPLLIFGLDMGIRGAALATVISQLASVIWVLRFLTGPKALLRLTRKSFSLDPATLKKICGLGLTGFSFSFTESFVQAYGNSQLQRYGTDMGGAAMGDLLVAAMAVIVSARQIISQPVSGLTQGAQPVIGYNYGAGQYSRVRKGIRFITGGALSFNLLTTLFLVLFPQVMVRVFNDDPALTELCTTTMRIYFSGHLFMGLQTAAQNTFVALGRAKFAVFFALFRKMVVIFPLLILLPKIPALGAYGIFMAEPISDVVSGLFCYITMLFTVWREMKKPDEPRTLCPNATVIK